mmetsp:Transcript_20419/g.52746  ORF Transcript_20419/g.52746 Transcript_20419/m.52746 type:complete len:224 (+) Transcript_20419:441-1112(+)
MRAQAGGSTGAAAVQYDGSTALSAVACASKSSCSRRIQCSQIQAGISYWSLPSTASTRTSSERWSNDHLPAHALRSSHLVGHGRTHDGSACDSGVTWAVSRARTAPNCGRHHGYEAVVLLQTAARARQHEHLRSCPPPATGWSCCRRRDARSGVCMVTPAARRTRKCIPRQQAHMAERVHAEHVEHATQAAHVRDSPHSLHGLAYALTPGRARGTSAPSRRGT